MPPSRIHPPLQSRRQPPAVPRKQYRQLILGNVAEAVNDVGASLTRPFMIFGLVDILGQVQLADCLIILILDGLCNAGAQCINLN